MARVLQINQPTTFDGWNPHPRGVPIKVRAGVVPPFFVLQVMEGGRKPEWEQDCCVPIRVRGSEDGGGAPGPSTSKGDKIKM